MSSQYGIIAQHQFDEGGLSATRRSDNGSYLTFGDCEAYIINDGFQCVRIVLEVYGFKVYALIFFFHCHFQSLLSVLIIHAVDFIDTLKTYLHILHRIEETHQLLDR